MTGKRSYWAIVCPTKIPGLIGPFRSEGEAGLHMLKNHTGGLLKKCSDGQLTRNHTIAELKL